VPVDAEYRLVYSAHPQFNFSLHWQYDAVVEAEVGHNRHQQELLRLRVQYGAAGCQRVTGAAGGGGSDNAVGFIGGQRLSVDYGFYLYYTGYIAAGDYNIVKHEELLRFLPGGAEFNFKHCPFVNPAFAGKQIRQFIKGFFGG